MIFNKDTVTVTLEQPAQYPYAPDTMLAQAKDKSASGVTHVENFELQTDTFTYTFKDMSDNDYQGLMGFFINEAQGQLNTFNLTDDYGATREVRFMESRLRFTSTFLGLWQGKFSVEVQN